MRGLHGGGEGAGGEEAIVLALNLLPPKGREKEKSKHSCDSRTFSSYIPGCRRRGRERQPQVHFRLHHATLVLGVGLLASAEAEEVRRRVQGEGSDDASTEFMHHVVVMREPGHQCLPFQPKGTLEVHQYFVSSQLSRTEAETISFCTLMSLQIQPVQCKKELSLNADLVREKKTSVCSN